MKEALPRTFEQNFFKKKQKTKPMKEALPRTFEQNFFRKKQNTETHERGSASHF